MIENGKKSGGVLKRSLLLAKHRTSASLEKEFWDELQSIAAARGTTLNRLVTEIDAGREGNLSSALRLFVLAEMKKKTGCPPSRA